MALIKVDKKFLGVFFMLKNSYVKGYYGMTVCLKLVKIAWCLLF